MIEFKQGQRVWWRLPTDFAPRLSMRVYVKAKISQLRPGGMYLVRYHAGLKVGKTNHKYHTVSGYDLTLRAEKEPVDEQSSDQF